MKRKQHNVLRQRTIIWSHRLIVQSVLLEKGKNSKQSLTTVH